MSGIRVDRVKMFVLYVLRLLRGDRRTGHIVGTHGLAPGDGQFLRAQCHCRSGSRRHVDVRRPGTTGGTIIGAFVIGILSDGLVMMGISSFWQMVIKGIVIIVAVVVDQAQRRLQQQVTLMQLAKKG